ncbi:hypothetical protein [Parvibaculum sp.]|uniref:hypothetical protein n=1 Tax=Parvibaculum sp. TaxID=2024848 RepID=UPI001B0AB683|nr:hypothetical protein [Parvibaculum sp.]MBO6633152.1 hypothetical protein [Parvibaculum sp.]MBO6679611.1 hypothetical protein [Parvibaculum sp.]MBO6684880.1 hypothetical protein [Parvibaculum sp.]MBO6905510.1 hypothetical protein [Parvibaculum sp.]
MAWNIVFEPLLPVLLIAALAVPGIAALAYSAWRRARGAPWRTAALAVLVLALLNPTVRQEDRETVPDVAAIVVDRSQSQEIGARPDETSAALTRVAERLAREDGIETRIVTAVNNPEDEKGTALFAALEEALADVPRERIAGAIMITDGQVHDVPKTADALGFDAPVHGLIIGRKGEKDRRLRITEAPRFGIVGEPVDLSFRVDETSAGDQQAGETANVTITVDGEEIATTRATIGETTEVTLSLAHGGPNVIEIDVEEGPDELTVLNNRAVVVANGVRDRLRVLLVSGEPHPGERTWRNLLKSDPSVDLVHFTILRPPEKQDGTPIGELSLIAFPTRELFDEKLDEFDLIIFDRYKRRGGVLPIAYFLNIVDYVENGGAFLAAAGPAFASPFSIYRTPLAAILPAQPTGETTTGGYTPGITDTGDRHPVTADLPGAESEPPAWGRWFRTIDAEVDGGDILMETPDGQPLMVLARAREGRVAQLLSDQIWLWSRGYEGGGPQAELLRRLAHWLMKEPDLEEENLAASAQGGTLTLRRRTMRDTTPPATVTTPTGKTRELAMEEVAPGRFEATMGASELGLYRVTQGDLSAVAAAGPLNPREIADVRATEKPLRPITDATGGGIWWAGEDAGDTPGIRSVRAGQDAAGSNWIGLRRNEQYLVHAVHQVPLLTGPVALILILGALALAWWREGR